MAFAALALYCVSLAVTFGLRVAIQVRQTGSTGLHGLPPDAGAWERIAAGLFIAGLAMGGAAPVLALLGVLEPIAALDGAGAHAVGLVLAVGGIALTFGAQLAMGDSWRVGVDPEERTALVTDGPFRLVRNPIYSAMLPTVLGLVLMVPSVLALAALLALFVGLELQVRLVEEPYLVEVHGEEYTSYAARVGRFVPRLGLLHVRGQIVAILIFAAALGSALLAPRAAVALDSDLKGSAVFRLEASHGYTILGLAASERIDGRGDIGLIVYRRGETVSYLAPAIVTPTKLEANLGALGRISAEIVPSGRKRTLRSRCGGDDIRGVEPNIYRGSFEFHGELGYADAVASEAPEYTRFFLDLLCPGNGGGEAWGPGLPGARLTAFSRRGDRRLSLQLSKNRPGGPTVYSATVAEARGGIAIRRSISGRQAARAFEYDSLLRTATVEPVAPFSGTARFYRDAAAANRWTGSLAVDFPGEPNVPLTGAGFSVHMVHARKSG